MGLLQKTTCFTCRADIREVHTRNGGHRTYNPDHTQHLCFPDRTDTRDPELLTHGEILLPPSGRRLPAGTEAVYLGTTGAYISLWFYDDGKRVGNEDACRESYSYAEFAKLNLVRALRFRPEPLPEPGLDTDNGWLALSGELYPCKYNEHIWLAGALEHRLLLADLEGAGFVKLQKGRFYYPKIATQRQFDTMIDYITAKGEKPSATLRNMEIGTDQEVRAASRR